MLAVQISTSLTGKVTVIEWSSSSQAAVAVGSKKCPRREMMLIWCIDYFLIYWLWKLWEQMSGYFACFCAVVWCETTLSDLSLGRNVWLRERGVRQLRVIWHWEEMCGWERKDRDLADTYSDLNFLLCLVRWSSCEITQGKLEVERERYWDLIFRLVRQIRSLLARQPDSLLVPMFGERREILRSLILANETDKLAACIHDWCHLTSISGGSTFAQISLKLGHNYHAITD
jgi:hypothetical protein